MGRFKNESTQNPIVDWLLQQDYKYDRGASGEKGYIKVYPVSDDFYYVWVTISLKDKKIYIYKEYSCGGCVGEDEIIIEDEWLNDLSIFIDNVDEKLEFWIGE
ncbi:hypothetical protein [Clostridium sp.]|uniref:hypothetical protein n=1 Tax=Clostridium sp. TaxID=1506 RepID=UPI00261A5854|nr:hypothetical protein [Clostridium sp.]